MASNVDETAIGATAQISPMRRSTPALKVDELGVERHTGRGWLKLVSNVTFEVASGSCVFLVGPSGVGKSVVLRSILGLLDRRRWRLSGTISVGSRHDGIHTVLEGGQYRESALSAVRGHHLAAIFQEPTTSLHPSLSVGRQLLEVIPGDDRRARVELALKALDRVRLGRETYPDVLNRYPHQFSQGERQRICVAMALCVGGLIVADEPTASLDPDSVGEVSRVLLAVRDGADADALLVVTHQLDLLRAVGRPGDTFVVLDKPSDDLPARARVVSDIDRIEDLHACFRLDVPALAAPGPPAHAVLEAKALSQKLRQRWFRARLVLENATFCVAPGEMVGIIGASGSGKTTLARAVIRLLGGTSGGVLLDCADGRASETAPMMVDLLRLQPNGSALDTPRMRLYRRHIQYISQEAATAFNPRIRIGEVLEETLKLDENLDEGSWCEVSALCKRLGLASEHSAMLALFERYPAELSGGQKQRLVLLRALLRHPKVIIADEPFTGQDMRTTSDILQVIADARRELGVAVVLISHDHHLVHRVCTRIYRLEDRRLTELPRSEEGEHDGAMLA